MSEMDYIAADTSSSPNMTRWTIDKDKLTLKVEVSASYDTYEEDGSVTVRAATPVVARSLTASLVGIADDLRAAEVDVSAEPSEQLEYLGNSLSGPFAQAAEMWWQTLSNSQVFTKTYPSLAARGKAIGPTSERQTVLMSEPQKYKKSHGSKSNKKGSKRDKKKKGSKSSSKALKLEIEINGLRNHQYRLDGATFLYGRPLEGLVKIGTSGTLVSSTGGDTLAPLSNIAFDDPWHVALTAILNHAINRTHSHRDASLSSQPLPVSVVSIFEDEFIKLAIHESQGGAVQAPKVEDVGKRERRPKYSIDFTIWSGSSDCPDTIYLSTACTPEPPESRLYCTMCETRSFPRPTACWSCHSMATWQRIGRTGLPTASTRCQTKLFCPWPLMTQLKTSTMCLQSRSPDPRPPIGRRREETASVEYVTM